MRVNKIFKVVIRALAIFVLAMPLFINFTASVKAQGSDNLDAVQETSGLADVSLPELIGKIINVFLSILGIVFLVLILYAGFLWMTAGGDGDKVDKAKKVMINATIGLVIVLSSYAISSFIINKLTGALSDSSSSSSSSSSVSVEALSGSLGSGGIKDHYPARNATDIARNTKIYITFKEAMDIESFIEGYDVNGTPEDTSDDTTASGLNTDNVLIYASEDGEDGAFASEDVSVSFTDDLKTFVFDPPLLGSASENVSYTVYLDDSIKNSDGEKILNSGGYEWSFEVGTETDTDPPTITSVTPAEDAEYDRNITVQITFSEAIDPTSATGTREEDSGFDNIQTYGEDGVPLAGEYEISNNYKTITFTSANPCGTNSCGDTIYCLPANEAIGVTAYAATVGDEPPQASSYPYDGIVDTAGNSLDGNDDGEAGDDYSWSFSTSGDINLDGPEITSITPNIKEEDVNLDQKIYITFDSVLMSSTVDSDNIVLEPDPEHELWYSLSEIDLNSDGEQAGDSDDVVATKVTINHGVFLESSDEEEGTQYMYSVTVGDGIKNEYQNCFAPGEGPTASGGSCGTSSSYPYCCNGTPSASECQFFE
ncbi:hypothetical protein D6827_04035 [Candidatus Parcubacteria bacterium]|nr:MAG: hypothetical protein D6827_04035 [Candidatus Parcubacteria bacterium]